MFAGLYFNCISIESGIRVERQNKMYIEQRAGPLISRHPQEADVENSIS